MALLSFKARLGLDATGFEKNMARANSQVENFGNKTLGSLKSKLAGAFTVAAIAEFGRAVINHADKIGDLAEQYNLTTDAVQELMVMASKTGVEFDRFGNLLLKISELRDRALKPGEDGQKVRNQFSEFGIGFDKLNSNSISNMDLAKMWSVALKGETENATALEMVSVRGIKALSVLHGISDLGQISFVNKDEIETLSRMNDILGEIWRKILVIGAHATVGVSDAIDVIQDDPWWLAEGPYEALTGRVGYTGKDLDPSAPISADELAAARMMMAKKRGNRGGSNVGGSLRSIDASPYQSSADKTVAGLGGYYLGGDATARNDLARQALELAKKTADSVRKIEENTGSIRTVVTQE